MNKTNSKIFIGSSSENRRFAQAIEQNLERLGFKTKLWILSNSFGLSDYPLESLLNVVEECDFGVFVFGDDNLTKTKHSNNEQITVRDNVLFEFGLFVGKRGKRRVYFVLPKSIKDFRVASDLQGLTHGYFDDTEKRDFKGSVSSFCTDVENAIEDVLTKEENEKKNHDLAVRFYDRTRDYLIKKGAVLRKNNTDMLEIQESVKEYTDRIGGAVFGVDLDLDSEDETLWPPLHPNNPLGRKLGKGSNVECGVCLDKVCTEKDGRCPNCKLDCYAWIGNKSV